MGRWIGAVATDDLSDQIGGESETEDSKSSRWTESLFEKIFLQNYARVVMILLRLVGDRDRAEELANDVFWKLYRRPLSPDQNHNLAGWLYRTATCLGLDFLRSDARRKRYEGEAGRNSLDAESPADPLHDLFRSEN